VKRHSQDCVPIKLDSGDQWEARVWCTAILPILTQVHLFPGILSNEEAEPLLREIFCLRYTGRGRESRASRAEILPAHLLQEDFQNSSTSH